MDFFLFIAVSSCYLCSGAWRDVFLDADLTFIFAPKCSKMVDKDADWSHFKAVIAGNPFTPLRHIVICHTQSDFLPPDWGNTLQAYVYQKTEKSLRFKSVFVRLEATPQSTAVSGYIKCEYLIIILSEIFRQEYIFGRTVRDRDAICFKRAAQIVGSAKLILLEGSHTLPDVFIPCLTCNPITFKQLKILSFSSIRQSWDAQNRDMRKYLAFFQGSINVTCGPFHRGYLKSEFPEFCPVATIAEKYNLTLLQDTGHHKLLFSLRSFGLVIFPRLNNIGLRDIIYVVRFNSINFVTVTNPPIMAGGIETFVSPFDPETWACLLISVISVAIFLTWSGWKNGDSLSSFAGTMVDKIITVTCVFLGYVGDSTGKEYRSRKIVIMLITLWLFGNFILMTNIYQGSIYSLLTILVPPQTPSGVKDLLNWDIPLIAMDTVYHPITKTHRSYILDHIIPELIFASRKNSKLINFVTKFGSKVLSINDAPVSNMVDKTILENSSRTHHTIALLGAEETLADVMKQVKFFGNRRGVQNKGDSPFRIVEVKVGIRNLLAPYFAKEWGRMREAGLNQMWKKVHRTSLFLEVKGKHLRGKKYFEAVQTLFGNPKETAPLHESTPVSVELMRPIFGICSVIMALGVVGFLAENRRVTIWKTVSSKGGIFAFWCKL